MILKESGKVHGRWIVRGAEEVTLGSSELAEITWSGLNGLLHQLATIRREPDGFVAEDIGPMYGPCLATLPIQVTPW